MALSRLLLLVVLLASSAAAEQGEARNPDPFEPFNRSMFALNDQLDRFLMRPLAQGYDVVMPAPAKRGVGNLLANLYDFNAAINAVLQGRLEGAAQSSGRFVVNSTLGVVGLFDVATRMGIRPYRTDFGHTLAIWGFDSGPYLMVPFFGPRTVRSGAGTIVDIYTSVPAYLNSAELFWTLWGLELIHGRAALLSTDELISGDRYIFVRDAYLQFRETQVNDGEVIDTFSDFEDGEEEWEDF
jgi:phospholipid-binding lipoprotein MlaA